VDGLSAAEVVAEAVEVVVAAEAGAVAAADVEAVVEEGGNRALSCYVFRWRFHR
jgi:hypothetical protein